MFSIRKPGWIELGGTRACLFDSLGGFYHIREHIAQEVGIDAEADICQRAGYCSAEKLVATAIASKAITPDEEGFRAALSIYESGGFGRFEVVEMRLQDGWARIVASDCIEGWMYHEKGTRHGNTCDFTRGFLTGLMHLLRTELTGATADVEDDSVDQISCVETSCLAAGEDTCTFVVGLTSDLQAEGLQPARVAHSSIRETLLRLNRQLENILDHSRKDHLTNLYNRSFFESALRQKIGFAKRRSDVVSLALIDVDHFKTVNDTHGHAVGDRVLRQLGYILEGQARENDIVARLGGDEFVWLMPATPPEAAGTVARRLAGMLDAMRSEIDVALTVSVGVAGYPRDAGSPAELMEVADNALYVAKEQGRNRVILAGVEQHEPSGGATHVTTVQASTLSRASEPAPATAAAAVTHTPAAVATPEAEHASRPASRTMPKLQSLRGMKARVRSASRSGRR